MPITGGPHAVGVTFVDDSASLLETRRQPYNAHFNMHRHPRLGPAVYQMSITGPFEAADAAKKLVDTPSRRRILIATPSGPDDEEAAARTIVAELARRAYRRPVEDDDLRTPMKFYLPRTKNVGTKRESKPP